LGLFKVTIISPVAEERKNMKKLQEAINIVNLDHLGIVAGIIDEMELVEEVNKQVGLRAKETVSPGQVMKAMILNGLGFLSAPLYLFEAFFVGKGTEHLIGEGITAEQLNDDRIGRALDKYYRTGTTKLFTAIALKAASIFQVKMKSVHLDSSSISVEGEYQSRGQESEVLEGEIPEIEPEMKAIKIVHGYSKARRPDLKQFIIDLIVTGDGDVPLSLKIDDGNAADKSGFVARLKEAQIKILDIAENEWQESGLKGYRIALKISEYGQIKQRWLVIESEVRKAASIKQIDKEVEKQLENAKSALRQLSRHKFACQADGEIAIKKLSDSWKYHRIKEIECRENLVNKPMTSPPIEQVSYQINGEIESRESVIKAAKLKAGRFILATNILDEKAVSNREILEEYKAQQSNERGFRFLKDPLFFTSSVFVKNPQRVEAIAMIMGVCLLVYNLAQRKLRQELEAAQGVVRNQVNKFTNSPTMRWIFQMFQAVHLVTLNGEKQMSNLTQERQDILKYLGKYCQQYYLIIEDG
jgi:transposase